MSAQNVRGQNLESTRALGDRRGGGGSKATRVRGHSVEDEDMTLTREALSSLLREARGRAMPMENSEAEGDSKEHMSIGISGRGEAGEDGGHDPTEMGDDADGDTDAVADADSDDEVYRLRQKATRGKSR